MYIIETKSNDRMYNTILVPIHILAHLIRRLIGKLINTHSPSSVIVVVVHNVQTRGKSKLNFMWSIFIEGEQNTIQMIQVT